IDSLYKSRGYYLARIVPETTSLGDRVGINFRVDEGRRLAVSGLRVLGAERVDSREVVKAMETRPEGFWWFRRGEFDEDVYATDLGEKLPTFYAQRGYVDFQIERDTLVVDAERGKALVELTVREGDQYSVSGLE